LGLQEKGFEDVVVILLKGNGKPEHILGLFEKFRQILKGSKLKVTPKGDLLIRIISAGRNKIHKHEKNHN
jgi:hypothetical protein